MSFRSSLHVGPREAIAYWLLWSLIFLIMSYLQGRTNIMIAALAGGIMPAGIYGLTIWLPRLFMVRSARARLILFRAIIVLMAVIFLASMWVGERLDY